MESIEKYINTVIIADVMEGLGNLPDNSINCVVTSPPYWGLRDYGTARWEGGDKNCNHMRDNKSQNSTTGNKNNLSADGIFKEICKKCGAVRIDQQIGLEKTLNEYVEKMVQVFREVRRVLREDGTLWLNLGDTSAGSWGGKSKKEYELFPIQKNNKGSMSLKAYPPQSIVRSKRMERGSGRWGAGNNYDESLKPKDICGIPWRVAFALQQDGCIDYKALQIIDRVRNELLDKYEDKNIPDKILNILESLENEYIQAKGDSWWLRQDIIWHKPNPMPESVKDRCTKAHEYIFLLSKSKKYYFDYEAIREKITQDDLRGNARTFRGGKYINANKDNNAKITRDSHGNIINISGKRNKRSVWTVATQPFPDAHFATFPEKLIIDPILAGCPEGGIVLDPFIGRGTTGLVASCLNRKFIGIELNPEYKKLHKKYLNPQLAIQYFNFNYA